MLDFAARHHIAPQTEHFPMSRINDAFARLESGKAVTYAVGNVAAGAPLISYHAYQVVSVNFDQSGKPASVTLRNPWGVDGAGNDGNNDGFVTITAAQAQGSFLGWTAATV